MNSRPVEFEFFPRGQTNGHRDRQFTNMTNLIVVLRGLQTLFKTEKISQNY